MHPTSTASGAKTGSDSYTERGTTGSLCYFLCSSAAHVLPQHVASLGTEMCQAGIAFRSLPTGTTSAPSAAAAAADAPFYGHTQ